MKIDELDEFQGITSEMIQAWLLATGWKQVEQMAYQLDAPPVRTGWLFRRGDETVGTGADISYVLANLSRLSCKTPQALLREINPRMREGVPSEAARQAHPGNWLVSGCLNQSKEKHFEVWHSRNLHLASNYPYNPDGKRIECWPLDEHGSKVRWPTDSEGKML